MEKKAKILDFAVDIGNTYIPYNNKEKAKNSKNDIGGFLDLTFVKKSCENSAVKMNLEKLRKIKDHMSNLLENNKEFQKISYSQRNLQKIIRLMNFTGINPFTNLIARNNPKYAKIHQDIPGYIGIMYQSTARYICRYERDHIAYMLQTLEEEAKGTNKILDVYYKILSIKSNDSKEETQKYRNGIMEGLAKINNLIYEISENYEQNNTSFFLLK